MNKREIMARYYADTARAGITYQDAETLRRAAMVAHRCAEHECNGTLYRAEEGDAPKLSPGKVYAVSNINGPGELRYSRTADRETPARERAETVAARYGLICEWQGDPRGWPLTLKTKDGRDISPPVCS